MLRKEHRLFTMPFTKQYELYPVRGVFYVIWKEQQ